MLTKCPFEGYDLVITTPPSRALSPRTRRLFPLRPAWHSCQARLAVCVMQLWASGKGPLVDVLEVSFVSSFAAGRRTVSLRTCPARSSVRSALPSTSGPSSARVCRLFRMSRQPPLRAVCHHRLPCERRSQNMHPPHDCESCLFSFRLFFPCLLPDLPRHPRSPS